jgi:hypothetical protein
MIVGSGAKPGMMGLTVLFTALLLGFSISDGVATGVSWVCLGGGAISFANRGRR